MESTKLTNVILLIIALMFAGVLGSRFGAQPACSQCCASTSCPSSDGGDQDTIFIQPADTIIWQGADSLIVKRATAGTRTGEIRRVIVGAPR